MAGTFRTGVSAGLKAGSKAADDAARAAQLAASSGRGVANLRAQLQAQARTAASEAARQAARQSAATTARQTATTAARQTTTAATTTARQTATTAARQTATAARQTATAARQTATAARQAATGAATRVASTARQAGTTARQAGTSARTAAATLGSKVAGIPKTMADDVIRGAGKASANLRTFAQSGITKVDDLIQQGVATADDLARAGLKAGDDLAAKGFKSVDDLVRAGAMKIDDAATRALAALKAGRKLTPFQKNLISQSFKNASTKLDDLIGRGRQALQAGKNLADDGARLTDDVAARTKNAAAISDDGAKQMGKMKKFFVNHKKALILGGVTLGTLGLLGGLLFGAPGESDELYGTAAKEEGKDLDPCQDGVIPKFEDIDEQDKIVFEFTSQADVDTFYESWCALSPEERDAIRMELIAGAVEDGTIPASALDEFFDNNELGFDLEDPLADDTGSGGDSTKEKSWLQKNWWIWIVVGVVGLIIIGVILMFVLKKPEEAAQPMLGFGLNKYRMAQFLDQVINTMAGNMLPY